MTSKLNQWFAQQSHLMMKIAILVTSTDNMVNQFNTGQHHSITVTQILMIMVRELTHQLWFDEKSRTTKWEVCDWRENAMQQRNTAKISLNCHSTNGILHAVLLKRCLIQTWKPIDGRKLRHESNSNLRNMQTKSGPTGWDCIKECSYFYSHWWALYWEKLHQRAYRFLLPLMSTVQVRPHQRASYLLLLTLMSTLLDKTASKSI